MEIKKITNLVISILYIFINYIFYRSIFVDYPNIILFVISITLVCIELIFWKMKFILIKEKLKDKNKINLLEIFFLIVIFCVGLSRIFLHSSPYLNDLINTNFTLIYVVGIFRILFIFVSIVNVVFVIENKLKFFILPAILNLIIGFMIWLDFDNNINGILRILIGIIILLYAIMQNKKQEEKN